MKQHIAHVSLVVKDYTEAIDFYTKKLDFVLVEDKYIAEQNKQWVLIAPPGARDCCLLLAKASNPEQEKHVGNQTGGRVSFFLFTDDFWRDYEKMRNVGITFVRLPKEKPYGTVAVFEDLYGNLWDLLQPNEHNKGSLIDN